MQIHINLQSNDGQGNNWRKKIMFTTKLLINLEMKKKKKIISKIHTYSKFREAKFIAVIHAAGVRLKPLTQKCHLTLCFVLNCFVLILRLDEKHTIKLMDIVGATLFLTFLFTVFITKIHNPLNIFQIYRCTIFMSWYHRWYFRVFYIKI